MSTRPPSTPKLFFFFMLAHLYGIIFLPTGQTSDSVFVCMCVSMLSMSMLIHSFSFAFCSPCFCIITMIHCSFKVHCVCACYMCLLVTAVWVLLYTPWAKTIDSPFYCRALALSALASGTGQAFCASLPGLCFHLIILTALTLPFRVRVGGGWRWGSIRGCVFAKVKWWLLMLSPLNTCLVQSACSAPESLVTITRLPMSVPQSGLRG